MQMFLLGAQLFAGSLYLAGVFVAAVITGNPLSWKLALISAGTSYLCVSASIMIPHKFWAFIGVLLWSVCLVFGAAAGLRLL